MADKVTSGQRLASSPLRKADVINDVMDMRAAFKRGTLQAPPDGESLKLPTDTVVIRNDSGADLERGTVVKLDDYLLDPFDSRHLWFEGIAVTEPAHEKYAIMLRPVIANDFGPAQVSGVCTAAVNVANELHTCAEPVASAATLGSCIAGPIDILSKLSATGGQYCVVRLGRTTKLLIGQAGTGISKGSSGDVQIWLGIGAAASGSGLTLYCYARVANIVANVFVACTYVNGGWEVSPWECGT